MLKRKKYSQELTKCISAAFFGILGLPQAFRFGGSWNWVALGFLIRLTLCGRMHIFMGTFRIIHTYTSVLNKQDTVLSIPAALAETAVLDSSLVSHLQPCAPHWPPKWCLGNTVQPFSPLAPIALRMRPKLLNLACKTSRDHSPATLSSLLPLFSPLPLSDMDSVLWLHHVTCCVLECAFPPLALCSHCALELKCPSSSLSFSTPCPSFLSMHLPPKSLLYKPTF